MLYMHSEVPNTPIQDIIRLCQNAPDAPCAPTDETWRGYHKLSARSAHPGGVNVMMLDTSVHFAQDAVSPDVWKAASPPLAAPSRMLTHFDSRDEPRYDGDLLSRESAVIAWV